MFETFGYAGQQVGASPDGRLAFEPLADSVGPVQGRDRKGPTAMLRSVARLPLHLAAGTPVLNLRVAKGMMSYPTSQRNLRALIETYFSLGGMQLQILVVDRAELLDALEHPDRHEDLIVRIGGYSTYFNWLSPDLKQEVIK
jgi:formate C-acetyltransferase